jgi:hypothetical protein
MTPRELKQPHSVFKAAGRNAFLIGVDPANNPHKQEPYRSLWDSGFRRESQRHPFNRRAPFGTPVQDPFERKYAARRRGQ